MDDSGRVFRGARAVNEILRRQRGLKRLSRLSVVHPALRMAGQQAVQADRGDAIPAPSERPFQKAGGARELAARALLEIASAR